MCTCPATGTPLPRPDWLPVSLWPFQTYAIHTPSAVVAVAVAGMAPATLLLVHTGLWSFIWRDVMAELKANFRCICIDAPSTGFSAQVPVSQLTLEESSRAIAGVIERLDLSDVTLAVHDLGGPAALAAVADMPHRVRGLVALNTFAWKPANARLKRTLGMFGCGIVRELDACTGLIPRIAAGAFGIGRNLSPSERRAFLNGIRPCAIRAFHRYMASARKSDAVYARAEAALRGPLRGLPVLTIFGERNDPFGFQREWKRRCPHAVQIVVPRGNHFPMCDNAPLVSRSILAWYEATK